MKKVICQEFQKQNVPPHSIMFPPDTLEFYFAGALPHPTGACGFAETRETEGTWSVASWSEVVAYDKVPGTPTPLIME